MLNAVDRRAVPGTARSLRPTIKLVQTGIVVELERTPVGIGPGPGGLAYFRPVGGALSDNFGRFAFDKLHFGGL